MKKEDLGALKNLYEGIFSNTSSENSPCNNPTVSKTITNGLGIYESQIKNSNVNSPTSRVVLNETVTNIVSSTPSTSPLKNSSSMLGNSEWGSKSTIRDISELYSMVYEAKSEEEDEDEDEDEENEDKKENKKGSKKDQDEDGDNDFADVRIARMIASGMSKAEAIAAVKNKEYNEEFELDEATRMRKELGKEGETATRKELAARSKEYKRSGSVDKTIAAAERGADRPYIKHKRDESDADRKKREEKQSRTLRGLAASRRGSVRDKPRAGMSGYASKVEGGDKDLQSARQKAMSAGTLTPKEKKQLGEEYELYNVVVNYILENNFADDIDNANTIIENMSVVWVEQIINEYNEYVEDYNMFVENVELAGYDLDELTDEDLEEAYKDIDKKKAVEKAANKEKAAKEIEKINPSRAKGIEKSNRLRGSITGGRKADRPKKESDKSKDEPGGYGDLSKYTGDIYAKKFKPGKSVPKVMKFGRPFGKYQPRAIKFGDIKKMGLD